MDEMAAIIFYGKVPVVSIDGKEGVKDLKVIDAIYEAIRPAEAEIKI